jgi:DNA-binding MarR family transcriptional regulator
MAPPAAVPAGQPTTSVPAIPAGGAIPAVPTGGAAPSDAAELADALLRAMKRIRRQTAAHLEPYGITPGQGRALRVLAHALDCETPGRPMRLSELADRLHIAPRSATTVVDALEAAGLVERLPDQADRRAVGLHLTEGGRRAVERIGQIRHDVAEEYFGAVSAEDRCALLRVLRDAETAYGARADPTDRRREGCGLGPGPGPGAGTARLRAAAR